GFGGEILGQASSCTATAIHSISCSTTWFYEGTRYDIEKILEQSDTSTIFPTGLLRNIIFQHATEIERRFSVQVFVPSFITILNCLEYNRGLILDLVSHL
ncbi:unnamed protein product, partial [Scytosiphon promiscuus]